MSEQKDEWVDPEIDEEQGAAIARIVTHWSVLEFHINQSIWFLMDVPAVVGNCATAQIISINLRLDAFVSLVKLRGGSNDFLKSINRFSERATILSLKRNRVVHDAWMAGTASRTLYRYEASAKKNPVLDRHEILVEDLNKISDDIIALRNDFQGINHALNFELLDWADTLV